MSDKKEKFQLSQTHTSCKKCVFAKYEGKTQTGCELGKIDNYKDAGIGIVETFDDDKEFFVIDGRFCLFYRNEEYMKQFPKSKWKETVNQQTKIPYHAIVFINEDSKFKDVKLTLRLLKEQEFEPVFVTLVNKQYLKYREGEALPKPSEYLNLLQSFDFHQFSFKNIHNEELDDRALVDLVFDSIKDKPFPFYVTFKSGFHIPKDFSKKFNDFILVDMKQVGFAKPVDDLNMMIVNRITHKKHSGNSFGIDLEKKIEKFEDNGSNFIFEASEIC